VLLPAGFVKAATTHAQPADAPAVHKNVVYGMHGGLALLMDVYEPAESNGHALLYIAGSGWHWPPHYGAGGIKDAVASGALGGGGDEFADVGFTVFVINHRQAPLFRYPAAVEDARRAVRYIRHHGDGYGVTEEAIAAFGISSGAHLVLTLALGDGAGDPESTDEVERHSSKVDVVAAFAGPTDLAAQDWGARGSGAVTSFIGAPQWMSNGAHAEASPVTYVDGDDPPVLLIHGDADEIVPVSQAQTLAARLREHQVEVEYVEIAGGGHDFDKVLNHDPNELPAFPAIARWLRDHLSDADQRLAPGANRATLDGKTIHYEDYASDSVGLPIVLVHGGAIDSRVWTYNIPGIAEHRRVIVVDLPGHGRSEIPRVFSMDVYAAAVAAVLDDAAVREAVIVGQSMGVSVARRFLRKYPERCAGLVCVDGRLQNDLDPQMIASAIEILESGSQQPVLARVRQIIDSSTLLTVDQVALIEKAVRDQPAETMAADFASLSDETIWASDPIDVPVLIVDAKSPRLTPGYRAYVDSLVTGTPFDYQVWEGVTHLLMIDKPQKFNETVLAFVRQIDR
jgi:pimeloyl-ACP methyl ester carboxylesterase